MPNEWKDMALTKTLADPGQETVTVYLVDELAPRPAARRSLSLITKTAGYDRLYPDECPKTLLQSGHGL